VSNIFQPKRIPGLPTPDELAVGIKEYAEQQKTTSNFAPPNTSALEFADKTIGNAANDLRRTTNSGVLGQQPVPSGAEGAGQDRMRLPKDAPQQQGQGILGSFGVLEPGGDEQQNEHDIMLRGAVDNVTDEMDAAARYKRIVSGEEEPPVGFVPGEPSIRPEDQLQFAVNREAARRRALIEAEDMVKEIEKTPPTQTWWRNAMDVGVRSAAQVGVSIATAPVDMWELTLGRVANAGDIKQSPLGAYLDGVDKSITQMLPGDPARSKEFVSELAGGVGSMAAFLLAGYVGSVFGAPAGVSAGLAGAASGGNMQYEDAERFNAHGLQKYLSFFGGAMLGLTEGLPIEGAIRRALPWDRAFFQANAASDGLLLRMLNNTSASSLEEFVQEFGQSAGQDLIAKFVYDPNRELDVLEWAKNGVIGGIVGAGMGTVTSVMGEAGVLRPEAAANVKPEQQQKIAEAVYAQGQTQLDAILGRNAEAGTRAEDAPLDGQPDPGVGAAVATPATAQPAAQAEEAGARLTADPVMRYVPQAAVTTAPAQQMAGVEQMVQLDANTSVQVAPAIETPEFKAWFKDSAVRRLPTSSRDTAPREPLVVYHGTQAAFTAFKKTNEGTTSFMGIPVKVFRRGNFFAEDKAFAESFASQGGRKGRVVEAYLSIQNPLWLSDGAVNNEDAKKLIDAGLDAGFVNNWLGDPRSTWEAFESAESPEEASFFVDALQRAGFDGVRMTEIDPDEQDGDGTRDVWVAFDPTQIKSATGNDGSFDADDPNIDSMVALPADPRVVEMVQTIQLEASETMPLPAIEKGLTGPIESVVKAARAYATAVGMPHRRAREYVKVDVRRAERIAQAYTDMKHEPADPAVQAAYKAMAEETIAQYQFVKATGIKIETIKEGQPDPYPNGPRDVLKDIAAGHIWYFPTDQGFGSSDFDASDNPLLEPTQEVSDNGVPMVVNDLFRVVHDFFGHGLEGAGFGARGEENAWQSHMRLFSAMAVPAMTSETRGQNSWVNYGPFGEANRANPRETTYADQKTGLMPSWTWQEGVDDSGAYALDGAIELTLAPSDSDPTLFPLMPGRDPEQMFETMQATRFFDAISNAKEASPWGAKVHVYGVNEYFGMRLFLTPDELSGFALKGDDIVSVFSHPAAGGGRLKQLLDTAIVNGGRRLDAFDGKLVELYARHGFKEVSREAWNEEYKPVGWQEAWGTPDVVFMEFDGDDQSVSIGIHSAAFKAWDDGAAIREPERGNPEPGAEGPPLLLYSGGPKDFRRASRAMWLTPDRSTAEGFASGNTKEAEFDEEGNNIGGAVFTYWARMENPYEVDFEGNSWNAGPQTEYPTIYVMNGDHYSEWSEADAARDELLEQRAQDAADRAEQDIDSRISVVERGGVFEVVLAADPTIRRFAEGDLTRERALIERYEAVLAPGAVESLRSIYEPALAEARKRAADAEARVIAARAAEREENLGTFETEDAATDFVLEYTTQQMEEAEQKARDEFDEDIREETDYESENPDAQTTDREVSYAASNGYDGVIFRNVDEGNGPVDVYVILEPGNAKSTANRGTFNREDPDILFMAGTSSSRKSYGLEPSRPAAGIPEAPDTTPVDATLAGISKNLADLLDLTVRQKLRAKNKDVMGEYHRNSTVVRLRSWNDLSTLAHEAGHAFNDAVQSEAAFATFFAANDSRLRKVAQQLYQLDLSNEPAEVRRREGFAEFFRVYTLTPQYARKHWPQLTAEFEAAMKAYDPRLLNGLEAVALQFQAWLNMPSTDLMRGMVISGYRDTGIGAAIKELREAGVSTWMREVSARSAAWAINRYAPLNSLIDRLLGVGERNRGAPIDLNRADDPRVMVRLMKDTNNRANVSITSGVLGYRSIDSTTRGLQDVLLRSQGQPLDKTPSSLDEQRHKDFNGYLIARRALAEFERYEAGELERPPIDATKGEVTRAIQDFEKRYGADFIEAAQWAHEYGMGLWQLQYDAGLMTKEVYELGRQRTFYVPLQRDVSDKKMDLGSSAATAGDRLLPMGRRFRGSNRQIIDPMAVLMEKTFALEKAIYINDAKRSIAVLADRAGKAGALVERVPATQLIGQQYSVRQVASKLLDNDEISEIEAADMMALLMSSYDKEDAITLFRSEQAMGLGQNALYFWEDGKVAAVLVEDGDIGRDVVDTMNAVGRENMDLVMTAMATTSGVFREAIRLWPDFTVMNFLRDQPAAWVLTEGYLPFVDSVRGAFDEVTQKQIAKNYNASRGALGGMSNAALHVSRVNRDIKTLMAKGYVAKAFGDVQHGWDIPGVLRGLSRFTELTETGTRFGVYRRAYQRAIKEGLKPYEAGVEAAYLATDLMDFGLNGSKMLTTRRLIPFLNAQLQGLYKLYRTLGGDEVARRRGLGYALGAYFKDINKLPLSRVEKQHLRTGRKAWLKMLSLGVISAALHFLFEDDPDYQETSEYLRSTGWVIPTGRPGEIFYMPKPFEIAVFANAVERFLEFSGGDSQALSRFMRGLALTAMPPTDVPLVELGYGLATNTDIFTGAPIVPEHMKGFTPYLQFDHRTSNIAKWLGGLTGQSPMVVEHIMSSLFASAYRDVSRTVDAMDPSKPAMEADDIPLLRRLVRDARRGGTSSQDFYKEAGERQSTLSRALSAYKMEVDAGNQIAANANLARMSDDEKAYALLMTHFTADEKRLHPFYRTQQVVKVVNKMRREVGSSLGLGDTTDPDDPFNIALSARQKAEVDNMLSEIIRRETRNAMIIMAQPGWAGKEVLPMQQTLDLLGSYSADVYYELERRYDKANIYAIESVVDAWPETKDRLLFDRDAADLSDLVTIAGQGF
jgi:hypothetical protein